MTDTSSQRCLEQFERLRQPGLWARMFVDLLIGQKGWYSTKCRLTWKLKGTKFNRFYFQLVPSTLRIEETEFGLLPTPTTQEPSSDCEITETGRRKTKDGKNSHSLNLGRIAKLLPTPTANDIQSPQQERVIQRNGRFIKKNKGTGTEYGPKLVDIAGLLPTPTAMDSSGATANMKSTQVKEGSMHSMTLSRMLLPTPAAVNYKGASSTEALEKRGRLKQKADNLADQFHQTGQTSQLNPRFVAEMMGFPPNWTELPFLNGETNLSKPTEMP